MRKFRKGAASFYIVSFSTLILVIIAASFATVIISEVTRSSNDDLSQSAYDSALVGVEDAKIAFANYQRCIESGHTQATSIGDSNTVDCGSMITWMESPDCDMVGHMSGRLAPNQSGEVLVREEVSNYNGNVKELNQAYTCVMIKTVLRDYRANLTSQNNSRLVRVELDKANASDIAAIDLSWYSLRDGESFNYSNFKNGKVVFRPITEIRPSSPSTIEVQMIQTAESFSMDQINGFAVDGDGNGVMETDRASLFLVPTKEENYAASKADGNYIGVYDGSSNKITAAQVARTNSQSVVNVPYVVYCSEATKDDFMCNVRIELPEPIGGSRNNETFLFLVTVPYGEPDTDFSMSFLCRDGTACSTVSNITGDSVASNVAEISGVQILIDSTGRANDLFRRVETRLESSDTSFPYIYYALQLFGNSDNEMVLEKNLVVTSEHNRGY